MKKVIIACAAALTLGLMSCGDTEMCYKLSAKIDGKEVASTYVYGTSNEIDALAAEWKKTQEALLGGQAIEIVRSPFSNLKSKADCKGSIINLD